MIMISRKKKKKKNNTKKKNYEAKIKKITARKGFTDKICYHSC